jgi:predicted dehydrogenase
MLETARKGMIAKARARPDQAREVLERARERGIRSTAAIVRRRLEELGPLGYSAAGTVVEAGAGARGLGPGDRVAVGGGGFATHAELDVVPALLCARVPDGVDGVDAAFATLGAVALNGFRRGSVEVGGTVAVVGLGLIGQLAARIALAAGCRVAGFDVEPGAVELASAGGVEAFSPADADRVSRWEGAADAVLVCAATSSSDPMRLAAALARDRGSVVIIGDVGMDLDRGPLYAKELDLRMSRSYGPGRYDPTYELHGIDYPVGHVRWTEQRNMAAFLALVGDGRVRPSELVSHRFAFADAERAFELVASGERVMGVVLEYRDDAGARRPAAAQPAAPGRPRDSKPRLGLIGAGSFATATLVPGLLAAGFVPAAVASATGLAAENARRRFGFASARADAREVIDSDVELVAIATRHDSHAELAAAALAAGKVVYVEKPLALDWDGLDTVIRAARAGGGVLFVGFNRRHAPLAAALRRLERPRLMSYRVNAGRLPVDHWTNDLARGGGRLRGEGCHFIDFLCDQAAADPRTVTADGFPSRPELPLGGTDNFSVRIAFGGGSVGTVNYAADAPAGPGKERFETSFPGGYAALDDFRRGTIWHGRRRERLAGRRQEKGFPDQYALLARIVRGESEPPPAESFVVSTLATLAAARSLERGRPEPVIEPARAAGGARTAPEPAR